MSRCQWTAIKRTIRLSIRSGNNVHVMYIHINTYTYKSFHPGKRLNRQNKFDGVASPFVDTQVNSSSHFLTPCHGDHEFLATKNRPAWQLVASLPPSVPTDNENKTTIRSRHDNGRRPISEAANCRGFRRLPPNKTNPRQLYSRQKYSGASSAPRYYRTAFLRSFDTIDENGSGSCLIVVDDTTKPAERSSKGTHGTCIHI